MRLKRFFWIAPTTLLLIVSQTFRLNFPVPLAASPVVAQTLDMRKAEADRLFQQGLQQYQTSQFQAALQSWQQALAIYRAMGDRKGEGQSLGNLGLAYEIQGDYVQAIKYQQQHLAIAREIGDRQGESNALGNLASAYLDQWDYAKAIEYYQQSLTIKREIGDRQGESIALDGLGNNYRSLGNYAKAIEYYQQSVAIAREIGDRWGEGQSLENLASAYWFQGDYAQAMECYQQSLALARALGDRKGEASALDGLGNTYHSLGGYVQARDYYQQSLTIAREIRDRYVEGMELLGLGTTYDVLGNYARAIDYKQQSLAIAREIGVRKREEEALGSLGNSYLSLGDYDRAIEYYQKGLAIAREIGDRFIEGVALGSLGHAYISLGDYAQAIAYQQQSLALAQEIRDRQGEGAALGDLGNAYISLGDYTQAIAYHQKSLAIAREIRDRSTEGNALHNLGNAYISLDDYAQAIEYYQKSLAVAREIRNRSAEGSALGGLGTVYNSLGDYTQAIAYHQKSLAIAREIRDRSTEGNALLNLGNAYISLDDYAQAIDYYQKSLAIARDIGDLAGEAKSLNNLGAALLYSGNLPEAERILSAGIQKMEDIRAKLGKNDDWKVSIFEEQVSTYLLLQKVLIAQDKTNKALETAERGRARAFMELLTRRLYPQSDAATPIQNPSLEDIKKIAQQQNATIVEYSIVNLRYVKKLELYLYIWVVSSSGKVTFRQVNLKSLEAGATTRSSPLRKLIVETLESLGVGEDRNGIFEVTATNPAVDPQRQTKSLKQLHQLLIQPIADLLPSDPNLHIIFIPHQDLFRVPFPALIDSEGKYLVEKHTILTAPSIQVLELTHQQRQKVSRSGQGALVVGNPSPMPTGFLPLKGAEKEANDVAQLLKTKPLIGSQATEPAVLQQLPNARIIHLATHGTFNEQQPLLGGVALAQTGKDTQNDGLLTAEEIFNLKRKFTAELLVLSACNTGRGRITGDGVIGLSRSFIAAGIPSVIVSLWSVPDAPTAELMTQFYTNLYQKKLDKAQALRMAMLKIMEKYRDNPRAWAAFTLIGEAE